MSDGALPHDRLSWPRQLLRLWPEALLLAVTLVLVWLDGLRFSAGDPGYYWQVAQRVAAGEVPWRDFPFEYPPVSLPAVLLPYFLPGASESHGLYLRYLFSENVLLMVATGAGVAWLARRGWSLMSWLPSVFYYGVMALALAPAVVWRYDALPTLLTVLAVMAAAALRPGTAGVALGSAIMGKLYPLAMLPALFVGQIRQGRRRPALILALAVVATVVAFAAPFVFIAGRGAFSFLEYAITRGVQVESVPGALALLASVMGGPEASIFHGFGTFQVDSPLVPLLGTILTLGTVVLIGGLAIALWHRYSVDRAESGDRAGSGGLRPSSQTVHLLAALMVALVSSRILSPQYLFWVVPFVALASRPKALVFWVACLLTTFVYPLNYFEQFLAQADYTVVAVNIRNAILVAFTVWVLAPDALAGAGRLAARLRGATAPSG